MKQKPRKKIAIYHPYIHNMGGGETVALSIASILQEDNDVDVFITEIIPKKRLETFFDLNLSKVNFISFGSFIQNLPTFDTLKPSLLARSVYERFDSYDIVIDTCSNGIFEKKLGKKSLCYVHFPNFPKPKTGLKSLLNPFLIKKEDMFAYDIIICNSNFTKNHVEQLTNKSTTVIYPPVKTEHITPKKKKNIIVTIGRFSPEKKHEVMIESFIRGNFKNYELHIIGATSDDTYFKQLTQMAKGYNIYFHKNIPHKEVLRFLETARIYWHSRGYQETDPVEYENFGITTAEAIAAGCIPIVINLGAQPEIIKKVGVGYTWNTPQELIQLTKSASKKKASSPFSFSRFKEEILKAIYS